MKFLDKVALVLFSNLILLLAVIICLLIFGWISVENVQAVLVYMLSHPTVANIILGVCVVFILLAIKCIFFDSSSKEQMANKDGVLLANNDGKLLISKETLENLVVNVVKGFDGAQNVETKVVLDKENNITVYLTLFVGPDVVIKDLTINLQSKIKDEIKRASDLEVKEVNVKVRNIVTAKKEEMIKE